MSRNNAERFPHGIVIGPCTHSSTSGFKRVYSASTSWTRNSMMTVWLSAARGTGAEQLHRLGVANRQGTRWQNELSEDRRRALRQNTCDFLIEHDESIQVVSNYAYRSEIHETSSFCTRLLMKWVGISTFPTRNEFMVF